MKLHTDTRTRLFIDMTLDMDPAATTVELAVDGTWFPATWQGVAVQAGGKWTQTARTVGYFAGPTATAAGAVVLAAGRHPTKTRVTGPDTLVAESSPVDVIA
jgi:hypothetical protein